MIEQMSSSPTDIPSPSSPPPGDPAERKALGTARDVLTTDGEGVVRAAEQSFVCRFVPDPAGKRLIAPLAPAVFGLAEPVLWIPAEADDALALIVTIRPTEESVLTDRWQAWHGAPEFPRWAAINVDSGKHEAWVFDSDELLPPNPLAPAEPALCRLVNANSGGLARLCERAAHVNVPSPLCVGVDDLGLHVRARFGVVRVHFDRPPRDAEDAKAMIEAMLTGV